MPKKSLRSSKGGVSIPGQVERRLERAAAVWKRRCEGATHSTLMAEFGISKTCVHNYIAEQRVLLRTGTADLAAREREQALALLDNAIDGSFRTSMRHHDPNRDRREKGIGHYLD